MLRKLEESDVRFTIEYLPEYAPVRGNAVVSGDDDYDKQIEDEILRQLHHYNNYHLAWCTVKVSARWHDFEGVDYLGCCSFSDESEFIDSGYYEDMKLSSLDDLNNQIEYFYSQLKELEA